MFFQGTLQEGINTALQETKLVVCFVTGVYSSTLRHCTVTLKTVTDSNHHKMERLKASSGRMSFSSTKQYGALSGCT